MIITAIFVWIQAKATKELVRNDTRPLVEVSIINDESEGTFIQFLNKKGIPSFVWTIIEVIVNGKKVREPLGLRLLGQESWRVIHLAYRTAGIDDLNNLKTKYERDKLEISLEIHLAPLFLEQHRSRFYKKFYRFEESRWVDTNWGIPDDPFVH